MQCNSQESPNYHNFSHIFHRIVRAFLIEEQKIVVRVLKAQSGNKGKSQ